VTLLILTSTILALSVIVAAWHTLQADAIAERILDLQEEFLQHAITTGDIFARSHDHTAYRYLECIFDSLDSKVLNVSWLDLYVRRRQPDDKFWDVDLAEENANQCFINAHSRSYLAIYTNVLEELRSYMCRRLLFLRPLMRGSNFSHLDRYLLEVMLGEAMLGKGAALSRYRARTGTISQVGAVIREWQVQILKASLNTPRALEQ